MGYLPPSQPSYHSNLYQPQYNNPTAAAATAVSSGAATVGVNDSSNASLQSSNRLIHAVLSSHAVL